MKYHRLSDDGLRSALENAGKLNSAAYASVCTELMERRAQDLTSEEVEALQHAQHVILGASLGMSTMDQRALAVLGRLLASKDRGAS
jgi:hypothetical protein